LLRKLRISLMDSIEPRPVTASEPVVAASAITRDPPRPLPPSPEPIEAKSEAHRPALREYKSGRGRSSALLPLAAFAAVVLLALYASPALLYRWRTAEAQADAEAAYLRRHAELRAEAEDADKRLDVLDKRVNLVSLGFREVVRKVAPHVVNVAGYRTPRHGEEALLGRRTLFQDPADARKYVQGAVGSGILVKPGYVLTNDHVVRGAERLRLTFASGQPLMVDAKRVASDPMTDLAAIHLPDDLPEALRAEANVTTEFADSDKSVHVGDWALAVGSPLGLKQTVTHGVISAKGRLLNMLDLVELLQTDAPINPGNSGGPLFDQYGRVAGINVAIASETGGNQGIGFAIPSNTAKVIFEQLVAKGEVVRGFAGFMMSELATDKLKELGLEEGGGVVVQEVKPDQPAQKAGIQVGDVIVRFNREGLGPVNPVRQLRQFILDTAPGTQVTLEIIRGRARQVVSMKTGKRPPL
jgi:S1-C subfamily serine protease